MTYGFELGEVGWTLSGSASFSDAIPAYAGQRSLRLRARRTGTPPNESSTATRSIPVIPGRSHTLTMKLNGDESGNTAIRTNITLVDNGVTIFTGSYNSVTNPGAGWQDVTIYTFTPVAEAITFTATAPLPSVGEQSLGTVGQWYIDNLTITTAQYYPPENGNLPLGWRTWHVDDIMGTLTPREDVLRDQYHRLVDYHNLDERGHDEIVEDRRPVERPRRDL